ncbi:MAG: septum formation inhibitor Maf, partial [Luteibaculum sp.]
ARIYEPVENASKEFAGHWFDGKAELAVYDLKQSRYGQSRNGGIVLITVTEPFNGRLQVKADSEKSSDYNVLKTNLIKRFTTGIYDYSTMTSCFVPINTSVKQPAAKLSCSIQDWCGQAYAQMNRRDKDYKLESYSYFEQEVRNTEIINPTLLQDEVFSLIRLNPELLPQGQIQFCKSLELSRYQHESLQALAAQATLQRQDSSYAYTIITEGNRYEWIFDTKVPYTIFQWSEESLDASGIVRMEASTYAELKELTRQPYWSQNSNAYRSMRDSLAIPFFQE